MRITGCKACSLLWFFCYQYWRNCGDWSFFVCLCFVAVCFWHAGINVRYIGYMVLYPWEWVISLSPLSLNLRPGKVELVVFQLLLLAVTQFSSDWWFSDITFSMKVGSSWNWSQSGPVLEMVGNLSNSRTVVVLQMLFSYHLSLVALGSVTSGTELRIIWWHRWWCVTLATGRFDSVSFWHELWSFLEPSTSGRMLQMVGHDWSQQRIFL